MSSGTMSEIYSDVCTKHEVGPNPHISDALGKIQLKEDVTLKLSGNDRLRREQRLDDGDVLALVTCLRGDTRVTGLNVSYNKITDEGAGHLADLLQDGSVLRSLDLTFNDIQAGGALALAKSLQCNGAVCVLRMSGNKIGDGGAMHLARMLQVNTTLTELELASCDLGCRSVTAFAVVLKSNQNILCLDLSRPLLNSHQEEWAVHMSDMLVLNSSLLELHLGAMGMSNVGMELLSEGLKINRGLRYLDLRCNLVSSDGVRHLAEVLRHNTTLRFLDLSSNRIGDEGAEFLSAALGRQGCYLTGLSVRSNRIGTDGLLSLLRVLSVNASLTRLYVWGNRLDDPVCEAFRELMVSGRLLPRATDVCAYQVDGRVFLARVFDTLKKRWDEMDDSASDLQRGGA